jgi:hypothetical protein
MKWYSKDKKRMIDLDYVSMYNLINFNRLWVICDGYEHIIEDTDEVKEIYEILSNQKQLL